MTRPRARGVVGTALVLLSSVAVALRPGSAPVGAAATACGAGGTPNVVALADPTFYIDTSLTPRLDSTYVGYTVRAGASSETGLRMVLSGFTGGVVGLAPGESGAATLPSIPGGTAATSYFLLAASGITTTPQVHTIGLYKSGALLCERTFTYTSVNDTIKALANKVTGTTVSAPSSPAIIGDTVNVTVTGFTGTLGAGPSYDLGVLSYAPTALSGFPAGAWRLERTEMTISPDGKAAPVTYLDRLFLSGASGPDRPYTAKYLFRAVGPSNVTSAVQPVQYIASGTQVKHTDVSGSVGGALPTVSSQANLSVSKSASPTTFLPVSAVTTGGRVTYTVSVLNSGGTAGTLDTLVDTLPAGATFVVGSATVAGRPATPSVSGSTLTFYGPLPVSAGATLNLSYQLDVPNVAGTYTNSVVGTYAQLQIDTTRDVLTSAPASATVTVVPARAAVDAVNDSTSTNAASAVTVNVLANDSGTGLTVSIVAQPGNGTAVLSGNNIIYTPSAGFGGTDTFDYRITDGFTSDIATVSVSVPQARNDTYAHQASTNSSPQTLTVTAAAGLLANDFCSATPCTVAVTGTTLTGLTLAANGSFTYLMPTGAGSTSFTYRLTDANGKTADASVTIYGSDFGPDRAVTPYGTAIGIVVTANDVCTGTCNPTPTDPPHGTAVKLNDSTITYTPDTGYWGLDSFTYSKGGSGTSATVTVLVGPPTGTFTTAFGTPLTKRITDLTYATGVTLVSCSGCTYTAGSTTATKGTVSLNPTTGQFTYTPDPGAAGADTFTIVVTEPGGLSATGTVNITIGPDAVDDSASVLASTNVVTREVTINVLANDSCPTTCTVTKLTNPASGTLTQSAPGSGTFTYSNKDAIGTVSFTYQVVSSVAPSVNDWATVTIKVEGALDDTALTSPGVPVNIDVRGNDPCTSCTLGTVDSPTFGSAVAQPDGTVTYTPPATFAGIATFTYAVTKNGASTTAKVTVTVRPDAVNDNYSVALGETLSLSVLDNDICADCRITGVGTASAGSTSLGPIGLVVQYTAPSSGSGPFTFTYTITDSTGATDTATVTLTVALPPAALADSATTPAGVSKPILLTDNDTCISGTTCSVEVLQDASHGVVSLSAAPGTDVQYTPSAGFTGTDTFTYLLVASDGLSASAMVTVTVTPTAVDDSAVAGTGQTITIDVLANDECAGCTISIVTPPVDGSIGTITGTTIDYHAPNTPGTYTFVYRLTENDTSPASTVDATVTVLVSDAAPDAASTPFETPVTFDLSANDFCSTLVPPCGVTGVGTPSVGGVVIVDAGTRDTQVTYTPPTGFVGLATFTYTASNGTVTATGNVTVLVGPPPRLQTTEVNTPATGNLLTGVTCGGCTIELISFAGAGDITINPDGSYTYVPLTDDLGTDLPITYRITDPATGLSRDGTLTITMRATTPAVGIAKSAGSIVDTDVVKNGAGDVGDTVTYTYTVTNLGGRELTSISVTDDKIAAVDISCADGTGTDNVIETLAIAADVTCTGTYALTQSDVDAGSVDNLATATGSATGVPANSVQSTDTASVTIAASPSIGVLKTAGSIVDTDVVKNGAGDVGDTVTYTYVVSNTGNVTLTDVTLTDDKIADAGLSCVDGTGTDNVIQTLAPGDSVTCTGTYTLALADVNSGGVTNTASLTATAPGGTAGAVTGDDSATVSIARSPSFGLTKQGSVDNTVVAPTDRTDAGDKVTYTYVVSNTGNVTLTTVTLTDDKIASSDISCADGTGTDHVIETLDPGASVTCTAVALITAADLDAGSITNVATVKGDDPTATERTLSTDPVVVDLTQVASSSVQKTAGAIVDTDVVKNGAGDVGDTITYSYEVTNTGNVTLTDVTLTDDKIADADLSCADGTGTDNVIETLAAGDSVTCTGTYALTQADVDLGEVENTATVSATAPAGVTAPTDSTSTVNAPISRAAASGVVKTAGSIVDTDVVKNGAGDVGDTVDYSYDVSNTGNVTLTDVTLTDDKIADSGLSCDDGTGTDNVIEVLAVGASVTCTGTYTLTQDDVDAGGVTNLATVAGTPPTGASDPTDSTDTATVDVTPAPSLDVVKTAGSIVDTDVVKNGAGDVGDTVDYSYDVSNTGNVTLTDVTLTDDKIADAGLSCDDGTGTDNVIEVLAVGASVTCTGTYTLTQDDVDAGGVTNTAAVTGTAPSGAVDGVTGGDSATVDITRTASFTVTKTAGSIVDTDVVKNGAGDVGDTVDYSYDVSNTGNVTLDTISVSDDKIADADISCPDGVNTDHVIGSLAPGASVTCTGTYTLTQDDVDAGSVTNTATINGSAPTGATDPTETTDQATVDITAAPSLSLTKTAGSIVDQNDPPNGPGDEGDTIDYSYEVTNTGNVTLSDVTVTDDKIADADIACDDGVDTDNVVATLAPGASVTCTATYTLVTADVTGGGVTNHAKVTATAPGGVSGAVDTTDSATVTISDAVDAIDDLVAAPMGAEVLVEVLDNDTGAPLQVTDVGTPNKGTAVESNNTILVTPPLDFTGDITFTYTISNGTRTDQATVTVRVTENLAPLVPELFIDLDGDGVRDPGEPGIRGIGMNLDLSSRVRVTVGNGDSAPGAKPLGSNSLSLNGSAMSDVGLDGTGPLATFSCDTADDGVCTVGSLPVGNFVVTADFDLSKWGMALTADPDGNGDLSAPGVSGSNDPAVSFGIHGSSEVSGTAYVERGGIGGYQPNTDTLLPNRPVDVLWAGPDGQFGTDDDLLIHATSGSDGTYSVRGLPAGLFLVSMPATTLPAGVTPPPPTVVTVLVSSSGTADLKAQAPTAPLPATGGNPTLPVEVGAWLLGLGGLLTLLTSRRLRRHLVR